MVASFDAARSAQCQERREAGLAEQRRHRRARVWRRVIDEILHFLQQIEPIRHHIHLHRVTAPCEVGLTDDAVLGARQAIGAGLKVRALEAMPW